MRLIPLLLLLTGCQAGATVGADAVEVRGLRVALCQTEVGPDPAENLARIEAAVEKAAAQGAQLACFPEACVFGWVNSAAHERAEPIPGATTDRLAALAREHGMMIALGLAEKDGDVLRNTVVLIDVDGRLLGRHRKINTLDELMDPPYAPGADASASVFDTCFGRIGLLICADTFVDAHVQELAAQRPELVIVPYGWAAPTEAWPDHGASLHAWIANTARVCNAPVIGVDSTGQIHDGPWTGYVLGGQSRAVDARGERLATLPDREPAVVVVDLRPGQG